jgi:hypothetical protein
MDNPSLIIWDFLISAINSGCIRSNRLKIFDPMKNQDPISTIYFAEMGMIRSCKAKEEVAK